MTNYKTYHELRDELFEKLPQGKYTSGWGHILLKKIKKYLASIVEPIEDQVQLLKHKIKTTRAIY